MPVKLTPEEYAEKHARNLKGATEDIRRGIARVTEAPTAKAAAKQDKMLAGITEAIHSGKWAAGLRRVSLEEWKDKTTVKGVGRIAAGIDAAHDKVVDFATQLIDYENGLMTRIEAMPDLTLEDSISRATHWMREMSKFKRR